MSERKTRILNRIRSLYRGTLLERLIAARNRASGSRLWRALVPGHRLYETGEGRCFVANGLRWDVDISDYIGHGIYFGLDRSMDVLFDLANSTSIVFDVGVNVGWTALNLASRCPSGRVIGFEPDPANYASCSRNLRLNSLPNLIVEPLGLADRPGTSGMIVENERNRGGNRVSADGSGPIELTTIDQYCERNGIERVDLLKIDTEGFEHRIIQGGSGTLARHRPKLFVEVNDTHLARYGSSAESLFRLLRELGYTRFQVAGTETLIEDPGSLAGEHVDLVIR